MKNFNIGIALLVSATGAAAPSLQQELDLALRAGASVTLSQPEYRLPEKIILRNLVGGVIDGRGARITMTKLNEAIRLIDCRKVTLKNFILDYDPLPFTQGVVTELSPDLRKIHFQIDTGYPRLAPVYANRRIHVFTPDGKLFKPDAPDVYGEIEIISPERGICHADRPHKNVKKGDRIALDCRRDAAIHLSRCEAIRFENVTVYSSPGLVFRARFGLGGDELVNVKITRGPKPEGATKERLLSSSADGVNFAYLRRGPRIIDCDFSFMGDDGVNLHSVALPVAKLIDQDRFDTVRPDHPENFPEIIRPGDRIRLLDPKNFAVIGERSIRSFRLSPRHDGGEAFRRYYSHRNLKKWTAYEVTLEPGTPALKPGLFFDIPAIAANHYEIRDSYFHDHRARGVRLMASDGVIENNRFERIRNAAIAVGAEYGYWREAGWVENILIRGNRILDVGSSMNYDIGSYTSGAISVFCRREDYSDSFRGNRNITISDNIIERCPGAGIFLYSAEQVTLRNNRLRVTATSPITPGSHHGFRNMRPLWIVNSIGIDADAASRGETAP